ncbi:hypothetical protein [Sedimentitalea todarodis]|uniref:Uncharacterized protein n=1 Tax=Sedimentitalea todarodis TaxID=1631240 RepID=A0ABU3VFG6_9RHOB|nr:hypothetical protein [Sedimentitalea todarodis]MDU9004914.1 hypothetical protein [Sedimentitalea todarodis]
MFPYDRGVAVSTEALRLSALIAASVDALAQPPVKDVPVGSVTELAKQVAPAIHAFADLTDGFCRDAAAGVAVLPHQNDLEIGMELLSQPPEQVAELGRLIASRPWVGRDRTTYAECLSDLGVPIEAIDYGGPGTIKILILIILVLIIRTRPDLSATLIAVIIVVLRIDDAAQGDGKKCPCYKNGDGDGAGNGGGNGGGGDGQTNCGDIFTVTAIGDDPNPVDSIGKARQNAMALAAFACPRNCPPRLIFIGRLRTVKQADGTFRTTGTYQFRCT